MMRTNTPVGRRSLLRGLLCGGVLSGFPGCGDEGAGTVKGDPESGGQKRLQKLREGAEQAAKKPGKRR